MAGNGKSLAHRESVRYAAMNRGRFDGGDALANHNGFIPADEPRFQKLPTPRLKPATATISFTPLDPTVL
jgi:hypothetical protein